MRKIHFPKIKVGKFDKERNKFIGHSWSLAEEKIPALTKPNLYHPEFNNGLVGTIHEAYNNHIPILIKPDHIWIAIQIALANYVNVNERKFREKLVFHHEGKMQLASRFCGVHETESFIEDIFTKIVYSSKIGTSIFFTDFTTTTETDRYVLKAILMGQMKSYFEYHSFGFCGIPEYQIEGTTYDWIRLSEQVEEVLDFYEDKELTNWKLYLKFVLEHFINLDPENPFWQKPYSYEYGGSGSDYITGWSGVFSPFRMDGSSNLLPFDRKKILEDDSQIFVTSENIASSLVEVPFKKDGADYKIVAGLFLNFNERDNVVSPFADYFVV